MNSEDLRAKLAELGRKNLYFLCKFILGFDRLTPSFHRELCFVVEHPDYSKKLIIVPRGNYKSTIGTKGRPIQKLIQDPNRRILITSATATNAQRFLRHIKAHFEQNAIFRWIYPEVLPTFNKTTWSNTEIIINRSKAFPEPSIDTAGVGTAITGRHYDFIIKDDIVDDKNTNTPELIEDTIEWDASTLPLFDDPEDPSNEELVIGTPWHRTDVYSIKRNDPDFAVYIRHALENEKGEPDYEAGMPIFPERFPRVKLEKIRKRLSNDGLFFCQYMCDPRGSEVSTFRREDIQYYEKPEYPLSYFVTIDPGSLYDEAKNYTAYVVCGVNPNWNIYLLWRLRARHNVRELINTLFEIYALYPETQAIGIETVAWQKSIMQYAREEMLRRNVFLPIVELKTDNQMSKDMRIRGLIPYTNNKKLFIRDYMTDVKDELLDFSPKSKRKDLIDALAYQLQLMHPPDATQIPTIVDPFSMQAVLEELASMKNMIGNVLTARLTEEYEEPRFVQHNLKEGHA